MCKTLGALGLHKDRLQAKASWHLSMKAWDQPLLPNGGASGSLILGWLVLELRTLLAVPLLTHTRAPFF
ncbi:hypothetical protein ACHQM5_010439 [Ranunculus cassubicifolius]